MCWKSSFAGVAVESLETSDCAGLAEALAVVVSAPAFTGMNRTGVKRVASASSFFEVKRISPKFK